MGFRTNAILIEPAWTGSGRELLSHLGVDARPGGEEPLRDAWHPAHLSVGRLGPCTIVLDHLLVDLLLHREQGLEHALTTTLAAHRVLGLHLDDDMGSYGWVLWDRGVRRRARSGSARDGVRLDEGAWLPEERRWPVMVEGDSLRWVDEDGRSHGHARMGTRCVRWLSASLLGHPLDTHPDLRQAVVERYVERPTDLSRPPVADADREPLPRWLKRLLGR